MSCRVAVVFEGIADFETATELADRVLLHEIDWLEQMLLDTQREWLREDPTARLLEWKSMPAMALAAGIRLPHGHFDGRPGGLDARAARRAIHYVLNQFESVDAIILVRDSDDQPQRRAGLEQAQSAHTFQSKIVIALAEPERESWIICGFCPENSDETDLLKLEHKRLGVDPCLESHTLTACKNDQALRSSKRVVRALMNDDQGRQRQCWHATSLNLLMDRGRENGLSMYLDEVSSHIMPLITGHRAPHER